jgi:predicted AlkP superfamily phosphohydrolase/phosphomutase
VEQMEGPPPRFLIVSDHGFSHFDVKVHLNRWLIDQGYLRTGERNGKGTFSQIDWGGTSAYAIGLNSLYLNASRREGQGKIERQEGEQLLARLAKDLGDWRMADGRQVVTSTWLNAQAFDGPLADQGPDLVLGYAPGFRASAQTGMGGWEATSLEANKDHWRADHCIDPMAVPGVIFSSDGFQGINAPGYRDFPLLAIGKMPGGAPPAAASRKPEQDQEDMEIVEERLKSLGYF